MTIHIGLIGSQGKMGKRLVSCILKDPELSLAWQLGSDSCRDFLSKADVIIDFSTPYALQNNLTLAEKNNTPIVIGTTGLQKQEHENLEASALKIPVFWAPNFSLGIAALIHAIETLSPLLKKKFTPSISETHHVHKKDSPSGSALALALATQTGYSILPSIESIRLNEIVGEHTVIFSSEDEHLTLKHESLSRDVFALGALQAVKFLINKKPKLYSMKDLLLSCFSH